jgi:hypothetical protein
VDTNIAQLALYAQDACNASGIVFDLADFVTELEEERLQSGQSDDWLLNHPVLILFADKLDDLCGCRRMRMLPLKPPMKTLPELMATFKAVMYRLCEQSHREGKGTDWRNQQPEVQVCVLQLVYLTRSRNPNRYCDAYRACREQEAVTA